PSSGWNADPIRFFWRARTIRSWYRDFGAHSPHVRRIAGARMKTQWNGVSRPSTWRSASNDSRWRPKAFRSTAMSINPRSFVRVLSAWRPASFARRMQPAQVPMIGIASSVARRTISSKRSSWTRSLEIVVLSPPGMVSASTRSRSVRRRPDLVAFREHGLAHRRLAQGIRVAFVQGDDFEKPIEQDRPAHPAEDRHADSVARRIEGGVPLDGFPINADLEEAEFG